MKTTLIKSMLAATVAAGTAIMAGAGTTPGNGTEMIDGATRSRTTADGEAGDFRWLLSDWDSSYVVGFEGTCPATLTAADWPEGVEYIDMDAFNGCTTLQHLTLPAGIREICWHAFLNCEALETLRATTEAG